MWIFIWVVLSSILLGATFWSLKILMEQKKAWEVFAKKNSFVLNKGTLMAPPEMNGMMGDYKLSFFTAQRDGGDIRSRRLMTVMEISLMEGCVDGGGMGTPMMLSFLQALTRLHPFKIDFALWEDGHFVFIHNDEIVKSYLTPERIDVFSQILKTKNADVVILFNDKEILVRLETSDPMKNADKLEKIVKRQMMLMDKLRLKKEERDAYLAKASKTE